MNRLDSVDARVWNPALGELGQPGIIDPCTFGDLDESRLATICKEAFRLLEEIDLSAHEESIGNLLPRRQARFCPRPGNTLPVMLWADSIEARTLTDNLLRFGRARGMENWNQMYVQFKEWSRDKDYVDAIAVNTLRNIGKGANSPRASTLMHLAQFLGVPLYALFIEDCPAPPELIMTLNALVAEFVNGDDKKREAIRHMLAAFTSTRPTRAAG